jgi:integrase
MNKMNGREDRSGEKIDVPSEVLTPDEQTVDTSGNVWELNIRSESTWTLRLYVSSALDVSSALGYVSDHATRSRKLIRLYLAERLRSVKAQTVQSDLYAFKQFLGWWADNKTDMLEWGEVAESDWRAFLDHCINSTARRGGIFTALRSFYTWGAFQKEFSGFDEDIASSISQIRAPGNEKGKAVRTLDPQRGPLDDTEMKLISDALNNEDGTLRQRIIVRLLLELGLRPLTFSIIRGKHLLTHDVPVAEEGETDTKTLYQLEVPKLKDREAKIATWHTRPLSADLGRDLVKVRRSKDELLLHWLADHMRPQQKISDILKDWVRQTNIISPRTGQPLNLFSRRFRRTLATDMAVQGASRAQIAQALGHSDLQNVEVYLDASAAILDRMKEEGAFDFQDEVVDLFMGEVGHPDDEDVSEQRVPAAAPQVGGLKETTGNIGACQKSSPCSLTPPLSCYTCQKFVAFDDAPHADIKDELENWIRNSPDGVDRRIPQQHVTTIKAIRQLLKQLQDEREK